MRRTDWKTHRLPKSGRVLTVGAQSVKAVSPGTAQVFAISREGDPTQTKHDGLSPSRI